MRTARLPALIALTLLTACSFQVGGGAGGGGGGAPRTARAVPPPPRRANTVPNAPAPAAAPQPTPAPAQANAVAPTPAPPANNVARIEAITKRSPKACGYIEVAPGNWVHVDCKRYANSRQAVPHLSPRKARIVAQHKMLFKPITRLKIKPATPTGTGGAVVTPTDNGGGQRSEAFPVSVDHRALGLESPVKSQGQVGSCTAHSLSSALDNAAIRAGNLRTGDANGMASPMHVWSRYGLPDMGAAADGNISQPVGTYATWQQNDQEACKIMQDVGGYSDECGEALGVKAGSWRTDSNLMAKYNKSQGAGLYKIASIERLEGAKNMEELIGVLASGADVWAAMSVDITNWNNKKMTNAVIPDWTRDSGGHAVVISGYRDTGNGKQFMIHNSWGDSWGDHGYAWISEAMLNKWMYHAYRVKITNPVPKEDLTDDDCAPDELVDLGTGICAVMCGTEGRPNNGCH